MISNLLKNKDTILCGEGYLFELERRGYVQVGSFVPKVVLTNPNAVKELHREMCLNGSDIVLAFTYYGHREKLRLIGEEDKLEELNRKAIRIAKEVSIEFPNTLVAGNVSNSTIWDDNNTRTQKEVENMLDEQIKWAKEEGCDFIIGETFSSFKEANLALKIANKYNLECVITLSINGSGNTSDGLTTEEACLELANNGAKVVGLNCTRGPYTMLPLLKKVCETFKEKNIKTPIACLPVTYNTNELKPTFQQLTSADKCYMDIEKYLCTRYDMAEFAKQAYKLGVRYMGICCGGSPYHLRAMSEALGIKTKASEYSADLSKHFALNNKESKQSEHFFN